jgi:hypothetical protein
VKDPWDWDESDILSLIENSVPESLNLEFKACDALRNERWRSEFAKDVSAFANSAGGTLVYGIRESKDTHEAEGIDEGYAPNERSKEQLEQILNSQVQRRIEGIRYNVVALTTTNPNKNLFVIYVPKSNQSPHMANNRYYRRFEFASVFMDEYEVRERYGRETYPGKDIVRAWFDDAINPLLEKLSSEIRVLSQEKWSWNQHTQTFNGLNKLCNSTAFSPNEEDFINRQPQVEDGLRRHDEAVAQLNSKGGKFFRQVADSADFHDAVSKACSDSSLLALEAENSNRFRGSTASGILNDLFGRRNEDERVSLLAEWSINDSATNYNDSLYIFWQHHREDLYQAIMCPPLGGYRERIQSLRRRLRELNQKIASNLKLIRRELSEQHKVPVKSTSVVLAQYDPYGGI